MSDFYSEYFDEEELSPEEWKKAKKRDEDSKRNDRIRREKYEVGIVPPLTPELVELRTKYEKDYIALHQEVFTRSTGIKPFGEVQEISIKQTQHIIRYGGRAVIAEPRGYGKTSRTSNNALAGVLQGHIKYAVIIASSVNKANDIIESIKTELVDNQKLAEIYPAVMACFEKAYDNPFIAKAQTYGGSLTNVAFQADRIRFPQVPGEPSSGSVIQVRSKDNLRGLFTKIRHGPEGGRILRPDFAFLDDIQTDEEAESPTMVNKIVKLIKKSVLFGGTHSKKISAIMCCTPIAPGDVSTHFILNEPNWEVTLYKMVEQMPDHLEKWMTDYADIYMNFNKFKPGDRLRAKLEARKFVEENYELLHEGSKVSWDWAYGWEEDPQTEISALQHAMNFLIEEGPEAFETECQCNVEAKDEDGADVKATIKEITDKVNRFKRYECPVDTQFITTHIDVNKHILSYVTMSSPGLFRPSVIDYGTWPPQPGATWNKDSPIVPLSRQYPDIKEPSNQIYAGLVDLFNELGNRQYTREDGVPMNHNAISTDMGYMIDEVQRAIRDSQFRSIMFCARGQGITAKKKPFNEKHYGTDCIKYHHCALVPTTDRTLMVLYMDVNYFKTLIHRGIRSRPGIVSSIDLFAPAQNETHLLLARHFTSEPVMEDRNEEESRSVLVWSKPKTDNEYFDNAVGCLANFMKLGVSLSSTNKGKKKFNMQDYINEQRKNR